jgi:TATA-box binding protein (TBP) (component of TFIID and TFIIIB)
MIPLIRSAINPALTEMVYLDKAAPAPEGKYKVKVDGLWYWSTTEVVVVVLFTSGRVVVYGGKNADTIWLELYGVPASTYTMDNVEDGSFSHTPPPSK